MDYHYGNQTPIPHIKDCPSVESDAIFGIGITIIILSFISYLPQYFKIIQMKGVIGISALSLFIGCVSSFCNFFGTFLLDAHFWQCCKQNEFTHFKCFKTLLPIVQLLFFWIFLNVFYILFIIYFNKSSNSDMNETRSSKAINISFWVYILLFPVMLGITGMFLLVATNIISKHIILYGNILNIISSALTIIIWAPQIYTTYKERDFITLSPITLGIQSVGCIFIFLYQVLLSKSDLSIGIPFLLAGIQELIIVGMGLYFKHKDKKKRHQDRFGNYIRDYGTNGRYSMIDACEPNE